jgi:single-strand DNA-binding protein
MSISLNHLIIAGNLTRDPITKFLANEKCVVNFSIANGRKYKTASGEEREETLFLECTAFGKPAETIARYFTKGKPIILEGSLKMDQWDDKETGKKRSKLSLTVDRFHFVPDGKKTESTQTTTQPTETPTTPANTTPPSEDDQPPF